MIYNLASINSIENSSAVGEFGSMLGWLFVGLVALWIIATIARRVEMMIMPSIPIIVVAGVVGLLVIGLLHTWGL